MSEGTRLGAQADMARRCWACGADLGGRAMFCHACGKLQPPELSPVEIDDAFARLGLPRRFGIDPAALERQHAGFSARLAVECFARRGAEEQAHAARHRKVLDQARAELADPFRRAAHLLALTGHPFAAAAHPDLSPAASAVRAILAAAARADDLLAELDAAFGAGDLVAAQAVMGELGRQRDLIAEARLRRAELRES